MKIGIDVVDTRVMARGQLLGVSKYFCRVRIGREIVKIDKRFVVPSYSRKLRKENP